jgi:voltage-gated potassium channel
MSTAPIDPGATAAPSPSWRRAILSACLRSLGSTAVIISIYFFIPFNHRFDLSVAAEVTLAVVVFVAVVAGHAFAIVHSATPGLRAVEALAVFIPLLLVSFASIHYLMSKSNPQAFTEPLTRTSALYFTVTVFSTVGFGDITPVTDSARLAVTAQMIVNLLALGIGLRVIVGAVQLAKERQPPPTSTAEQR